MTYRICITGPSHVGKTSFLNRLINNVFYTDYNPTHEIENFSFVHDCSDSKDQQDLIRIEIHDTFPIDHPDISNMNDDLKQITENKDSDKKRIYDAYILMYNCIDEDSYKELGEMLESIT